MYCGNNANHPDLINGSRVIGTRYGCLLKGKQKGLGLPVDPIFVQPYVPINNVKKYCGNKRILPLEYDRFGGLYECYLKGVGVGKRIKAMNNEEEDEKKIEYHFGNFEKSLSKQEDYKEYNKYIVGSLLYIFIISLFFIWVYYYKPPSIYIVDKDRKIIDWKKFLLYFLIISIISSLIIYFLLTYLLK
jgi:hypothetical protein